MLEGKNIRAAAEGILAEKYPGQRLHDILEVPGGDLSHFYSYSDFCSLRPLILNRFEYLKHRNPTRWLSADIPLPCPEKKTVPQAMDRLLRVSNLVVESEIDRSLRAF